VAAGNDQRQRGILGRREFKGHGKDMAFDVVDADEGLVRAEGDAFGVVDADQQGSDQAGALRDRDAVNVVKSHACRGQRFADYAADLFQMLARGQFGHYAAIFRMRGDLRGDDV
jgi:hypothetical protein